MMRSFALLFHNQQEAFLFLLISMSRDYERHQARQPSEPKAQILLLVWFYSLLAYFFFILYSLFDCRLSFISSSIYRSP